MNNAMIAPAIWMVLISVAFATVWVIETLRLSRGRKGIFRLLGTILVIILAFMLCGFVILYHYTLGART